MSKPVGQVGNLIKILFLRKELLELLASCFGIKSVFGAPHLGMFESIAVIAELISLKKFNL